MSLGRTGPRLASLDIFKAYGCKIVAPRALHEHAPASIACASLKHKDAPMFALMVKLAPTGDRLVRGHVKGI